MKKSQNTEIFTSEYDLNLEIEEVVLRTMRNAMKDSKNLGMMFHDEYCNTVDISQCKFLN